MPYTDLGYDEFLNLVTTNPTGEPQELNSADADNFLQEVSADKIQTGALISNSGKLIIDLDKDLITVTNGASELVNLGVLSDGSIGLLLKNEEGTPILQFSTNSQFLQAADQKMILDFIRGNLVVKDDFDVPITVLGVLE